jgi:hypothetical protein
MLRRRRLLLAPPRRAARRARCPATAPAGAQASRGLPHVRAVGAVAVLLGTGAVVGARGLGARAGHGLFATGSALICLGVYFSGAALGLYVILLVWLAIFAAASFSARAIAAHIVWIMVASGATLVAVGPSDGPPHLLRWAIGARC